MPTSGNRLKKIRKELRLSQEEFGDRIGLSRAGIAAVEADKNNFSQDVLYKMISVFNVNLNYLIAGIGDMFNSKVEANYEVAKIRTIVNDILKEHRLI